MISVIIPTYNTALLIERAISSVQKQVGNIDLEMIIVDDCSTDETLKVVENIGDSRIRIFRQAENRGPAAARNRGLKEARGEYAAFLDGDDYWEEEFLLKTVAFLEEYPDAVAVSVMQCHKMIGKPDAIRPVWSGDSKPRRLENFFVFWAKNNHVCTGSVLMRTETARQAGGQREDLRVCEDLEFWALLATYGPWGFIPEVLFTSDGGAIVKMHGLKKKTAARVNCIRNIEEWGTRLRSRMRPEDWQVCRPILNRITLPGTYTLLRIGQFRRARNILSHYIPAPGDKLPLPVLASRCGSLTWLGFAALFWLYKHAKNWRNHT